MNATILSFLRYRAFWRNTARMMSPEIREVERKLFKEYTECLRVFKESDVN